MKISKNYEIVQSHYHASAQGNLEKMFESISNQVVWREMDGFPCAGTYRSRDQIIENVFKVLGRDWINYRFELEQLIDAGEFVIGIGNYRGKNKSTLIELNARVVHVWQLNGGEIIRFEQFTDTHLVKQAMTSSPK